jgi:hypothetical protein
MIAEAVKKTPEKNFETGSTAYEWFTRRIKNQRINNRKASISLVFEIHGVLTVMTTRARKRGWRVEGRKLILNYNNMY